jgi:hypothetical protein
MNFRFLSAGSFWFSRQIFFSFLLLLSPLACRQETKGKDTQISELQRDVKQLSQENKELIREIQSLREEMKQSEPEPKPADIQPVPVEVMTVERMKKGVEPLLKDVIDKLKQTAETPRKEKQYGMRIEYDLKNAVYGLMHTGEGYPPSAKVIVQYEKFLESGEDSRSIGLGNSTFIFAYQEKRWVLQSYE